MAEVKRQAIIEGRLWIFKQVKRGKESDFWHCKVYISRDERPMRSTKCRDDKAAIEKALEIWRELTTQKKTTGSTSAKTITQLCKKYIDNYELRLSSKDEGGSISNVRRVKGHIGTLFPAFCIAQGWTKPTDIDLKQCGNLYVIWREEEGWRITGMNRAGELKNGANCTKKVPKRSTIYLELQSIRKWSDFLVEEDVLREAIKIPKRTKFVKAGEESESHKSNPAFTRGDYRRITAAFRRWIKKPDTYEKRLKEVIYKFFLISTSVGWRYGSEGLNMKWANCTGYSMEKQILKGEEKELINAWLTIQDTKRNKTRRGVFINGHYIQELVELYIEWNRKDASVPVPSPDGYMFIDPNTRKRISDSQIYNTFTEKILPDCSLDREDYTYYSTRKYMINQRLLNGANPALLCEYTGHDLRVMFQHYKELMGQENSKMVTQLGYPEPSPSESLKPFLRQ